MEHSMDTLLEFDHLLYQLDQAFQSNDKAKITQLENEIEAFDKRWSLSCYST